MFISGCNPHLTSQFCKVELVLTQNSKYIASWCPIYRTLPMSVSCPVFVLYNFRVLPLDYFWILYTTSLGSGNDHVYTGVMNFCPLLAFYNGYILLYSINLIEVELPKIVSRFHCFTACNIFIIP
jgi:hypothetical protein